jgi:D-glycero-D-manno-heptose 1,7-bisphosphate phosphatase
MRVALLDRDGTINVKAPEDDYVKRPQDVTLIDGSAAAVRLLNVTGVRVAVVSNQRGIARGKMTESDLVAVNNQIAHILSACDAHVDLWLHCPHETSSCTCRKPLPGMLLEALARLDGDASHSAMFGDSYHDVAAGRAAGVWTVRIAAARDPAANATASSLQRAVEGWLGLGPATSRAVPSVPLGAPVCHSE